MITRLAFVASEVLNWLLVFAAMVMACAAWIAALHGDGDTMLMGLVLVSIFFLCLVALFVGVAMAWRLRHDS